MTQYQRGTAGQTDRQNNVSITSIIVAEGRKNGTAVEYNVTT